MCSVWEYEGTFFLIYTLLARVWHIRFAKQHTSFLCLGFSLVLYLGFSLVLYLGFSLVLYLGFSLVLNLGFSLVLCLASSSLLPWIVPMLFLTCTFPSSPFWGLSSRYFSWCVVGQSEDVAEPFPTCPFSGSLKHVLCELASLLVTLLCDAKAAQHCES